jgi:hypothetical protein
VSADCKSAGENKANETQTGICSIARGSGARDVYECIITELCRALCVALNKRVEEEEEEEEGGGGGEDLVLLFISVVSI